MCNQSIKVFKNHLFNKMVFLIIINQLLKAKTTNSSLNNNNKFKLINRIRYLRIIIFNLIINPIFCPNNNNNNYNKFNRVL